MCKHFNLYSYYFLAYVQLCLNFYNKKIILKKSNTSRKYLNIVNHPYAITDCVTIFKN